MRPYERNGVTVDQPSYEQPADRARYRKYDSDEYPAYGHQGHYPRKKRSFLAELFD